MWRPEPAQVIELARAAGLTLGSAESLTGGAVSAAIVAVPGASDVWRGAVVAYNADVKSVLLEVPASVIDVAGVVSADTALAMAHGARSRLGVDVAVSTTGVAGPSAHAGREVGTVVIGVVGPGVARTQHYAFQGDRKDIVQRAVDAAFAMLIAALEGPNLRAPGTGEQL